MKIERGSDPMVASSHKLVVGRSLPIAILPLAATVLLLAACGGDAPTEEELLDLPEQAAAHLRLGEYGEAVSALVDDFEIWGIRRDQIPLVLRRARNTVKNPPHIAHVEILDRAPDGLVEVLVIGISGRTPFYDIPLRRIKPFKVTFKARPEDGEWRILSATFDE